ncbi:MAG: hypothetical protein M9926_04340 [Lentimicrobium sp.]|jgi:hypothetical protein|uniref:hypothetical protein n=1 Tax=Lentimicrobium sp. TaxID=2034841 RepID=UPI0025F38BDF|nr:hypothetical protein [Lentimicrobium sp.]MCO5255969.1 hypothetical protein [Lentimicrobium sp.]MCO5263639.1 hypothetical protein [Lentimicrobium sp.]
MWKNDNFFIGMLASLMLTLASAAVVILAGPPVYRLFSVSGPENKLLLLAFLPGILLMRWYMRKFRFEKAGMGALLIVFISIILYFVFIDGGDFSIYLF